MLYVENNNDSEYIDDYSVKDLKAAMIEIFKSESYNQYDMKTKLHHLIFDEFHITEPEKIVFIDNNRLINYLHIL